MSSNKSWKIINCFLLGFFLAFLYPIVSSIPLTPIPISSTNKTINENKETVIQRKTSLTKDQIKSVDITTVSEKSTEISDLRNNKTLVSYTSGLPSLEFDINNNNSNSAVEQLTELSVDPINRPSVETIIASNDITYDLIQDPVIREKDNTSHHNSNNENTKSLTNDDFKDKNETKNSLNNTLLSVPLHLNSSDNLSALNITTPFDYNMNAISSDNPRNKRSFFRSSLNLNSNLDEILNMKRQRRASMRNKRNTNYEDLLSTLIAAEEAKYNDNYDSNPLTTNQLNYILNNYQNSEELDDKYTDLEKLNKYYYENLLPLIDTTGTETNSALNEDNGYQDVSIFELPNSQPVIPVIPYSPPNRYQRIRRSYYSRYRNPLSLYGGFKRKRNSFNNKGEWGRIVGADNDRSKLEDEAQEANKIYSLATLLATGSTPKELRERYKRSAHLIKRSIYMKNM